MPDGPSIGTAYLRVAGDFSQVQAQAVGLFSSDRWGKMGKAAGAAVAGGLAAGGILKGLYEIGQAFDDFEDKARVQTGASGKHLKSLERDFKAVLKDVPVDFATAGDAVTGLAQRLDLTGKPLRQMAKQMTALSKITDTDVKTNVEAVAKAFRDWEVRTKDQSSTLDGFFRLSQKSGVAVADIATEVQRFGSPLRQLGFSLEESAAMFAEFERSGVNTQTMVPGLKLAISNLTRPTEELGATMEKMGIAVGKPDRALRQVFALMEDKGLSAVEKTGLAMDVFGKRAGADMAEAIKQGRFEVDELMGVMEKGGKTIRRTEKQTRDFDESWQLLKNNLAVALEPAARKVFDEIGDIAEDITDVVSDKDLNVDQKIDRIADILGQAVERNGPKIAEAGGRIGLALIEGLWHAFTASDILGKAFIGAGALKMFGGAGALGSLGGRIGQAIGQRAGQSMATTIGGMNVFGGNEARSAGQSFGLVFGTAAAVAAAGNMIEGQDEFSKFWEGAKPEIALEFTKRWADRTGELTEKQRDLFKAHVRGLEQSGQASHAEVKEILADIRKVERELKRTQEAEGRGAGIGFAQRLAADRRMTGREVDDILKEIKRLPKGAQEEAANTMVGMAKKMEQKGDLPEGSARRLRKNLVDEFEDMKVKSVRESTKLVTGMAGNFSSLLKAVTGGLNALGGGTEKALKQFGVKDWKFLAVKAGEGLLGAMGIGKQRGGPIFQGAPNGDTVPAMLERGEYVLNREAVKKLGISTLDRINFQSAPRFQVGGMAGLQPGISRLATWAADRYGLRISSGLRPGDTDSFHGRGEAVDLIPPGMQATTGIFNAWKDQLAELFYDPWGGWDSGQHIPAIGGHMDHIHAAITGSGSGGPTAAAKKLAEVMLKGPKGPMRDAGQGGLDMAHTAAEKFMRDKMPSHGNVGIGDVSGPLQAIAQRMVAQTWGQGQWPFFNDLVQRESGWDPSAVNPSSGAAGLAQALPPSKYPPGAWPYQGKQSAVLQLQWMVDYIQERYGNPAGAIAHHDANNWYQKGGLVGMQGGGLVGRIHDLYDDLGDLGGKSKKGKGKKAKDAAKSLNEKIRNLTQRLTKRTNRRQKKQLQGIKNPGVAEAVSLSLKNWVDTYTDKVNVTDDAIARLEVKHGGTVAPESLEDAMSMLGLALGNNQEWEGIDPTTQQQITDLLGVEFGREQGELWFEITENEKLLSYLISQRNSVLAAFKEAEKQLEDIAAKIRRVKEEKERTERQARDLDREAEDLEDRAKKAKGQRRQELEARARRKRFDAKRKHDDAAFAQQKLEALTNRRQEVSDGRDTYQEALDEVQGPGSPTGTYITELPPLSAGGVPVFGGRLLEVQDHLRELGATKIVKPDFSSGDAASESATELNELKLEQALAALANARLQNVQSPIFEQFFREARLPYFHEGGVYRAPVAGEGPAMLRDKEVVLTPEQAAAMGPGSSPNVEVNVSLDGLDVVVETIVDQRERRVVRKALRRGPVAGQLARMPA